MKSSNPVFNLYYIFYYLPVDVRRYLYITFMVLEYTFSYMNMCSAWRWLLWRKQVADDYLYIKLCLDLMYICFIY